MVQRSRPRIPSGQRAPLSAARARTFFAVRNFCCIASSKVGFVRPGALHLDARQPGTVRTKRTDAHFQLYALGPVQAVGKQHRPKVDVVVMPAVERAQAVLSEVLNPLWARAAVQRGVAARGVRAVAGHIMSHYDGRMQRCIALTLAVTWEYATLA